nr:MAG TPA: hypothetical protein [Caudoviricetes sp.]
MRYSFLVTPLLPPSSDFPLIYQDVNLTDLRKITDAI